MSDENSRVVSSLNNAANLLARHIDAVAGGFPLVSVVPHMHTSNELLWQYGAHWFIVHFCEEMQVFPSSRDFLLGSPTNILVRSLQEAVELIRMTESIRQQTPQPLICLGLMPGTVFLSEKP